MEITLVLLYGAVMKIEASEIVQYALSTVPAQSKTSGGLWCGWGAADVDRVWVPTDKGGQEGWGQGEAMAEVSPPFLVQISCLESTYYLL